MTLKTTHNILPKNWVLTTVGEIGLVTSGGTPSTSSSEYWGDEIPWITPADLSNYKEKFISKGKRNITLLGLEYSSAKLLPKGSILFSSRAPIGYVAIAANDLATNQGFKNIIITNSIYGDYIYYYLKSVKQLAEEMASGTTFLELSGSKFSQIPFPLPPLNEQKRIVDKVEELYSELDQAELNLKNAKKKLVAYRSALLKSAFNGSLTNKWRNSTPESNLKKDLISKIKHINPKFNEHSIQHSKTGQLPESWCLAELQFLTSKITDGTHHTPKYEKEGVYFISVKDIYDGKIHFGNTKFISNESHQILIKRCNPEPGDILITKSGTIGRLAIVPSNSIFSLFVSVALIKPYKELLQSKYLMYALENHMNSIDIDKDIKGGVVKNYHLEDLRVTEIPYCSQEEQKQIIEELELRFTITDNIDITLTQNLQKIKSLRESILKQAFMGKLVNQDSNDELAKILLEKIQIEKQTYVKNILMKEKPKKIKLEESDKTILEVLSNMQKDEITVEDLWEKTKHKEDIEEFYAELKEIQNKINVQIKNNKSFITLVK